MKLNVSQHKLAQKLKQKGPNTKDDPKRHIFPKFRLFSKYNGTSPSSPEGQQDTFRASGTVISIISWVILGAGYTFCLAQSHFASSSSVQFELRGVTTAMIVTISIIVSSSMI